ncbi:MAG: sulfotransferase [Methylobacter sp.]|nr:sulfotransferase [Methylobacter sp.]
MMDKNPSPIFILSCERSGSTMLRYIVDTHSKIACPSHLYLGNLLENLNRMVFGTIAQTQVGLDEEAQKQFAVTETRNMVNNIMFRYTEAKGKQFWCEKTPMNLDYLSLLDSHFPDAKYICLYRHCMDVVHSSLNLSKYRFLPEHVPFVHKNPGNIIAAMTENWLEKTARLLAFEAAHSERCFRVTYESIVMQPEQTLRPLFEFLEVDWEDGLVERVFQSRHDVGEGDGKAALSSTIRQNSVGKGLEVPRSGIPNQFLKEIDRLLDELGYDSLDAYYSNSTPIVPHKFEADRADVDAITDLFENHFQNAIDMNRALYPMLDGMWKIMIDGQTDKTWCIDFSNQKGVIKRDDLIADFKLSLSGALLMDMVNGRRDAIEAFIRGEIQTDGINDETLLISFGRLLFS